MRKLSATEQSDEDLVKEVLADKDRKEPSTDEAIKELISRSFVIRLLDTGLEITAPNGIKVKPKALSLPAVAPSEPPHWMTPPEDTEVDFQFAQTKGWIGGLRSSVGLKAVLGVGIVLALIASVITYYSITSHRRQVELGSLVGRATTLTTKIDKTADEGMAALRRVQRIKARVTKEDIEEALNAVESAQELQRRSFGEGQELVDFVKQNQTDLRETELTDLVDMVAIYGDTYYSYRKSLDEFLASFKLLLQFEKDNYSALRRGQQPEKSKYEELYSDYMRSLERQNNDFKAHMAFVDELGKEKPSLKPIISDILASHQNDFQYQP